MLKVIEGRLGFYSSVIWYIAHCHYAERTDDDIIYDNFSHYYCEDKTTGFSQYFENPVKIDKTKKYPINYDHINNIENIRDYKDTTICGFILDYDIRKYMKFLIDKYLKINQPILDKINENYKNFKDKKVLGVHLRQTDLYTSHLDNKPVKPISIDMFIAEIEKHINNYDLLYLMSDNKVSIAKVKEYFKNKIEIFNVEDVLISDEEQGMPTIRQPNNKNKYKLGEDVLIEAELLSRCDRIIITNSNVSSFVLINNPDIKFQYLDLDINSDIFEKYEEMRKNGL